jgi:two-component system phosphate regulon sensor histidine kinase PhoR
VSSRNWKFHIIRFILVSAGILVMGWIGGHPGKTILAALSIFGVWHFVNIWRLYFWLHNPDRPPPGGIGVWADIFSRINSLDQRNRNQKVRYQSMIDDFRNVTDAFPDATLIIDQNFNLTWFNKAAGTLLELRGQRDIGRPVKNLIHSSDFVNWLQAQPADENSLEMATPGSENIRLTITSVSLRKDQRLIILRDVSEVRNAEQTRKDFVTNISHELRTPLTVMLGYLELLQDRPEDEMTSALKRMHTQAIQMQTMLDDLLELSRLQSVEAHDEEEFVNISDIMVQLEEQAEDINRGRHELHFEGEASLEILGVKSDLESAFQNLIVNALKYTPEGGSISVKWHDNDRGATISVTDTGIGIPKREIPRLTERFYRVGSDRRRESGGTGLGLAIVKHVLNGHQARLMIESEHGVGSQFTCIFPPERSSF